MSAIQYMASWMTLLFLCLNYSTAFADSAMHSNVMPPSAMDSNTVPKDSTDAKIDPALCNALVKHTPSADTAYQPGVDVKGNPVAPADLPSNTQPIKMPDKIDVPITVSLANILHLNTSQLPNSALGTGTEAWIGTLSVEGDNVSFNGQPLTDSQQDNLAVLCMKPDK